MRNPSAALVVPLISGKGGVGKSTLALALAAAWRDLGRTVALVDADPQGGLTLAAGVPTPADPLRAPPLMVHGLTLWPAGRALAAADVGELTERLEAAATGVELVLVDCSPALTDAAHAAALPMAAGFTMADGRTAAAGVVLVVARLDAAGLPNVAEAVALATAAGARVRVVPTFRGNTGLSREAEAFLRGRYGDQVTAAVVPTDARAAEAPGRGAPVVDTAPRSKATAAVRALAAELLEILGGAEEGAEDLTKPDAGPEARMPAAAVGRTP